MRDLYQLFATAEEPPPHNIIQDLVPVAEDRAALLRDTVTAILNREPGAGGVEASVWTDATLLRLRLSAP